MAYSVFGSYRWRHRDSVSSSRIIRDTTAGGSRPFKMVQTEPGTDSLLPIAIHGPDDFRAQWTYAIQCIVCDRPLRRRVGCICNDRSRYHQHYGDTATCSRNATRDG